MAMTCIEVASSKERREAARVRYDVYVEEQGKPYPEANHVERLLEDDLDETGTVLLVKANDLNAGTVRANWFSCQKTQSAYGAVFETDRFSMAIQKQMCVCTRLAVLQEFRMSKASILLFQSLYQVASAKNTELSFVCCKPALLPFFLHYGFREYMEPYEDPYVGKLHRTVLLLNDTDHLKKVGSPFLKLSTPSDRSAEISQWCISHIF